MISLGIMVDKALDISYVIDIYNSVMIYFIYFNTKRKLPVGDWRSWS